MQCDGIGNTCVSTDSVRVLSTSKVLPLLSFIKTMTEFKITPNIILRRQTIGGLYDFTTFGNDRGRGFGSNYVGRTVQLYVRGYARKWNHFYLLCLFIFYISTNMRLRLQVKELIKP